jgi:NodT family efflux transporter outer membrane factor (OMF) lipoprotein
MQRALAQSLQIAATVLLSSCAAVGPSFTPPGVESPRDWADWHSGDPSLAAAATNADAAVQGWNLFKDPALAKLLQLADENSPDVRTMALRFAQARAQRVVAGAAGFPEVALNASAVRQRQSEVGAATRQLEVMKLPNPEAVRQALGKPFDVYQAGFDASWEIDLWGRVRRSLESADAGVQMAAAQLQLARSTVHADIARSYVELLGSRRQLRLALRQVAEAEELLELTVVRARAGLTSQVEADRRTSALADLRSALAPLRRREAAALTQLGMLTGTRPGELSARVPLAAEPDLAVSLPDSLAMGLPSTLALRRPDIQAAQARLHAATARIGVAVGDLYPRVSIGGSFGMESLSVRSLGDWAARTWRIGPSIAIPLFDGGRRKGVVQLRELEQQEAAVAYQQTVLRAWHEVDAAVSEYQSRRDRRIELRTRLAAKQDALGLLMVRWEKGLSDFSPVVEARQDVLAVERDLGENETTLVAAWIAVTKAVAGGQPTGSSPTPPPSTPVRPS